jgi:hypothetical protein
MISRPSQKYVPDTADFAGIPAPARSAAYVTGKGINDGYPCATVINAKPSGGGRTGGATQSAVSHPRAKKGMY